MKKVTTFKFLSLLCFAIISQMSYAQISCLPQGIQLTADPLSCDYEVEAGDVLTPASFANFPNATIEVFTSVDMNDDDLVALNPFVGPPSGGVNTTLYVRATDADAGSCWTTVILEDKTPPVVDCPCTDGVPVTELSGELTTDSPTFDATGETCYGFFADDSNEYQAFAISVDADDTYSFEIMTDGPGAAGDLFAAIYDGAFDANDPCANQIAFNDDTNGLDPLVISALMSAGNYTLVIAKTDFQNTSLGTFTVSISSDDGGNVLGADPNCEFLCTELPTLLDFAGGPQATAIDACGPVTTERSEELIDNECGNDILRRTYTFTDGSGNSATCTYDITILPITDVEQFDPIPQYTGLPGDEDAFACDGTYDRLLNGAPSPEVTGYPTIDGEEVRTGGPCDAASTYVDQVIEICEGTTKYIRTWTVIGWCPEFAGPFTGIQVIKVVDEDGPSIDGLVNESISTTSTECTGAAIIQTPDLSDTCSPDNLISYSISVSAGTLGTIDGETAVFGLPIGTSTVTITAEDNCGNESSESYDITVEDLVNPIPVCETFHTVSLGWDPPTLVDAIVFDDGSYDNCEDITFKVRRMANACHNPIPGQGFTSFGDKVGFFCCDVGNPVTVVLQVTDGNNNTNECMVQVEVQDKLAPIISCPPNKPLDCHEDPFDTDLTGVATAIDNCQAFVDYFDSGSLNNCGEGVITRSWFASDKQNPDGTPDFSGNVSFCQPQTITVENSDPYCIYDDLPWTASNSYNPTCAQLGSEAFNDGHTTNDGIEWPADIELSTCLDGGGLLPEDLEVLREAALLAGEVAFINPAGWTNDIRDIRPEIENEDACDLVGMTYEDVELPIQPDACVKVLRTWKVYDWCTFDADDFNPNDPTASDGYWEYTQIIKVLTTEAPTFVSFDKSDGCVFEGCEGTNVSLVLQFEDDCTPDDELRYKYKIDEDNDGSIDFTSTLHPDNNVASDFYPIGVHRVIWKIEDGCGNIEEHEEIFQVKDCKKPSPYAHNFMAVELMPNSATIELWAIDLDNGSFDNCGTPQVLIMKGHIDAAGAAGISPPAGAGAGINFECDDIDPLGFTPVAFIAVDENGLWDFVNIFVTLQDNMGACPNNTSASVAGTIENEEAEEVQDVNVELVGNSIFNSIYTDGSGSYSFTGLPLGSNYTITPEKDGDYLNGVTTFDLVLMSKHILNVNLLDSPYKMIAADINKSGTITTFDMVELRKLILYIDTEFQNNTSWRFVDANFVFPDASNPFQTSFPEVYTINSFQGDEAGDFVAVKVGDVNCSAQVNPFAGSGDDRSANGEVVFGVQDETVVAGETYTVDFTAADFAEVLGYQFTLAFDKDVLEFIDVEGNIDGLGANNFGTSLLSEGVITTSWNSNEALSLDADAKVFSVTFVAKRNAQLSEVLAVNSRYTKAEAYDSDVNLMNIGLSFNGSTAVSGAFELYQNQPNPFKDETMIGFNLPEAGFASLTVFDVSGKVLHRVEGEFSQGFNQVSLNRSDLAANGVVYYQLDTENESATKKMIIIK